jgi:hypothetical protein
LKHQTKRHALECAARWTIKSLATDIVSTVRAFHQVALCRSCRWHLGCRLAHARHIELRCHAATGAINGLTKQSVTGFARALKLRCIKFNWLAALLALAFCNHGSKPFTISLVLTSDSLPVNLISGSEIDTSAAFLAPCPPPVTPERAARHTTTGNAAPPFKAKTRRAPEIVKKFANTCQHFFCQNTVLMRHALSIFNSVFGLYSCGFRGDSRRFSKMVKQDSIPGRVAI